MGQGRTRTGGTIMQEAVQQGQRNQRGQSPRPMDPYQAGGPAGYMARVNNMRMGGQHQPGGDPRQRGGGGKPNRQTVGGDAGGGMISRAVGGRAAMAGQGQGIPSKFRAAMDRQGGGQMYAGGSPGWAGGQGMAAPWQGEGPSPMDPRGGWGRGGGRVAGGGGKPNRQTVPGNAGGGAGGLRRGWRGRRPAVNPTAKRKQAQRTSARGGMFGGTTASRQARQRKTAKMRQGGTFG